MKCFPKLLVRRYALAWLAVSGVLILKAELPNWAQEAVAKTTLEGAVFRTMALPDGDVVHLRPAWESRDHLRELIEKEPHHAELYSLRGRQEERLADYPAAEADWKRAAEASNTKLASLQELADFYHRRVMPEQELSTLLQLASVSEQADEHFQPASLQPQWMALTRALDVANEALFPPARYTEVYNAWIYRYPREVAPYQAYLDWARDHHDRLAAATVAARLKAAFPHDVQLAITTDADLARIEQGTSAELAVYSKNFSPLWPEGLRKSYFQELGAAHQLRTFLGSAERAANADPTSLNPAVRLFFYYEQQGRKDVADQRLLTVLSARAARNIISTPQDLRTLSALLLRVADYDEAAQLYYSLYDFPSATRLDKQLALSALVSMLLDVPEQPLSFGNRDLSVYKNVARIDRHPGFLNGILSVALNDTNPDYQYQNASQTAVAYFHRASASRLIELLRQRFPRAPQTPELEAKLFSAYATYGQEDAIIRAVPDWLNRNRRAPAYVSTALLLADAYQSKRNTRAELGLYDGLLTALADRSEHMPIGPGGVIPASAPLLTEKPLGADQDASSVMAGAGNSSLSPDYSRVLDRYIARLVQLGRSIDAVAIFRREIDHNPDDPGIYERFALFLEQNRLDSEFEKTYTDALNHFKDMSWASKLSRYYIRREQYGAYEKLTQQITDTFKGSELAAFLSSAGAASPVLFRQVNLYAHTRFPHNLVFVKNLLTAYRAEGTRDEEAYEKLLRENWFYDEGLRTSYFALLSSTGKLRTELAALPDVERSVKDSNLAALEFQAVGQAWLTNYEGAAPVFVRLSTLLPGDAGSTERAISVERSLAAKQDGAFDSAIRLAQQEVTSDPGNREAVTRMGELYADREMYAQARSWWTRVASVRPGAPAGYLDSATVFWDYFQFNDALDLISEARRRLLKPALFSYEAGAIYENQGNDKKAIDSYLSATLQEGSERAKARLLELARRQATGPLVEAATARLLKATFDKSAFELRLAILEKLDRRSEIQAMLASQLPGANTTDDVAEISAAASRLGFDQVAADCQRRIVAMTNDPIEKMRARIELARFYEAHKQAAQAETEFSSLLQDEPNRLGVVRAAVDFYWRQKQSQAAVKALEAAADLARAPYQNQLRREAAEKAAGSGQYEEARRLLDQLLTNEPFNGDLLAQKAATYSLQKNTPALVEFYANELNQLQSGAAPAQDKNARMAQLRRGYRLALTTAGQFREALEQYQLILNAYPDDSSLASEVARYADAHQLSSTSIAFYEKATSDSPRDYRWPLVLARIETSLHHYPAAIAAYNKAVYIRPDRADLLIAKADLETRLLRFDDALKSYGKLYEVSFHDVEYLSEQAQLYARLGNKSQALRLLRAAYIEPHPKEASGYVSAMQQLASWHMYAEESTVFDEVRPLLPSNSQWKATALTLDVQALVALHRPLDAWAAIASLAPKRDEALPFIRIIGESVGSYLEPQERAVLSGQLENSNALPNGMDRHSMDLRSMDLNAFADSAGLEDLKASELMRRAERSGNTLWRSLDHLQSQRLLFESLGQALESIAKTHTRTADDGILRAAFTAYKQAGDTAAETRLLDHADSDFARLFVQAGGDLSQRLRELGQRDSKRANQVVQYLIMNGAPDVALSAISARGLQLTPLWTNSFKALTALFSLSPEKWGSESFTSALRPGTVASELTSFSNQSSPNQSLREANWFYYAARYGEYLGYLRKPEADDFLPASIEAKPAASNSYLELGDSLADLKQPKRSAQLYRQALQLSPDRADIYDRLALLAWKDNRRAEALDEWRRSFEILEARVEQGPLSPDYWPTARDVLAHANRAHAIEELKPAADSMLRRYAKRNGAYQFEPFLAGIFDRPPDRRAALNWVIDLARIPGMEGLLVAVLDSPHWVEASEKEPLYRAEIERAGRLADSAEGQAIAGARAEKNRQITRYATYLLQQKRWADEWTALQGIQPAAERPADLSLTAAALTGHLNELISGFVANPETAVSAEPILAAAASLKKDGHSELAMPLEEFEYGRELAGSAAPVSAWFGMAEVRFDQKRDAEALSLIRTATLSVGAPFENLPEAVHLLEKRGLKSEAASYAQEWQRAEPWDDHAQVALGRLKGDSQLLDSVRRARFVPYGIRVEAAKAMRDGSATVAGTDELSLLTHPLISPEEASQPLCVEARLEAARESPDYAAKARLYAAAIALDPNLREPRLQLAHAALAGGQDALGLAAFASYRGHPATDDLPEEDQAAVPASFIETERLAAEAELRRENWGTALSFYRDLLKRVHDPAQLAAFTKARDDVAEKQALRRANQSRRPVVTNDVAQPATVKPKLLTLQADVARQAAEGEE